MKKNNVRYRLDFKLMPSMVENHGLNFINKVLKQRGNAICKIFNSFYDEFGNHLFFIDNPKHFTEDQFVYTEKDFNSNLKIIHISLPEEHEGSDMYCIAYIFVCRMQNGKVQTCSMYTVEKSFSDLAFICSMTKKGHMNFGPSTGSVDGDIQRIKDLVSR